MSTIESDDIKQHVENVIAFPTCLTEVRKVIATYITGKLVDCSQHLIDTAIENSVSHYKQFVHNANITESVEVALSEEDVTLLNKSLTNFCIYKNSLCSNASEINYNDVSLFLTLLLN